MIPISRDTLLSKELDGVTYFAKPPIGEAEFKVVKILGDDGRNLPEAYAKAKDQLDRELKGQKQPGKEEYEKILSSRITEILDAKEATDWTGKIPQMNELIDAVVCNWKSEKHKLPEFPKDRKPSLNLGLGVKQKLFEWYVGEINLGVTESKN